jgi:hypothetical protein
LRKEGTSCTPCRDPAAQIGHIGCRNGHGLIKS